MKKLVPSILAVAILGFVLAPNALALKHCGDCWSPSDPANCVGVCNGELVRSCALWFQLGCPVYLQPLDPKEAFLLSLEGQVKPLVQARLIEVDAEVAQ